MQPQIQLSGFKEFNATVIMGALQGSIICLFACTTVCIYTEHSSLPDIYACSMHLASALMKKKYLRLWKRMRKAM